MDLTPAVGGLESLAVLHRDVDAVRLTEEVAAHGCLDPRAVRIGTGLGQLQFLQ